MSKLSSIVVVFFNLLIAIVLYPIVKGQISSPCIYSGISAWGGSAVILMLFHICWRYLGQWIASLVETITIGAVEFAGKPLVELFNALHFKMLSNRALWFLLIASGSLFVISSQPFLFYPQETTPIVQGFSVQFLPDGAVQSYQPNDTFEVLAGQQILVEPLIWGEYALPCEWNTVKGTFLPGGKCSTLYVRSIDGGRDNLTLNVQSPCKTLQTSASLFIAP